MTEQPLYLNRLEIRNFKQVEAVTVDLDGNHLFVTGANGTGKTSLLDSVFWCLGGLSAKDIPEPIHTGADEASVTVHLGAYVVQRTATPTDTRWKIRANGQCVQRNKDVLESFMADNCLDPVAFLHLRPQDQVDELLRVANIELPLAQVEEITGERPAVLEGESAAHYLERLSADETGLYYIRRREAHRLVMQKDAALIEQRTRLNNLGGPVPPNQTKASPTQQIADRLKELYAVQERRNDAYLVVQEAKAEEERLQAGLRALAREAATKEQELQRIAEQINALLARQKQLRGEQDQLQARIRNGQETVIPDAAKDTALAKQALAAIPDPAGEIKRLRAQLEGVEAENRALQRRVLAQEQLHHLGSDMEEAKAVHEKLDRIVDQLRQLRANLLTGLDLGKLLGLDVDVDLPSLSIEDGGLRLDGVPFRQASQAQRLWAGCVAAMLRDPRLRVIRIDEGERLDRASVELLLVIACKLRFQVLMTRVVEEGPREIEIVERKAS